jgi:hypothetical protein
LRPVLGAKKIGDRGGAASEISDAHGARIGVAVYLAEGLDLQGTGKGDQHIGLEIPFRADKADKAEKQHLNKEYALPPVQTA